MAEKMKQMPEGMTNRDILDFSVGLLSSLLDLAKFYSEVEYFYAMSKIPICEAARIINHFREREVEKQNAKYRKIESIAKQIVNKKKIEDYGRHQQISAYRL